MSSNTKTGVVELSIDWDNGGEARAEIVVVRTLNPFLRVAPSADLPADFRAAILRWLEVPDPCNCGHPGGREAS